MAEMIRRYTTLPFALHLLATQQVTLLSPSGWNDQNDAGSMEKYRQRRGLAGVLAWCATEASETAHHWSAYSDANAGVCITFHKDRLVEYLSREENVRSGSMRYMKISEVRTAKIKPSEVPFLKRSTFEDEREFRVVYEHKADQPRHPSETWIGNQLVAKELPIGLDAVADFTFCHGLPDSVYSSCKAVAAQIPGTDGIRFLRTTLNNNASWLKHIERSLDSSTPGM